MAGSPRHNRRIRRKIQKELTRGCGGRFKPQGGQIDRNQSIKSVGGTRCARTDSQAAHNRRNSQTPGGILSEGARARQHWLAAGTLNNEKASTFNRKVGRAGSWMSIRPACIDRDVRGGRQHAPELTFRRSRPEHGGELRRGALVPVVPTLAILSATVPNSVDWAPCPTRWSSAIRRGSCLILTTSC